MSDQSLYGENTFKANCFSRVKKTENSRAEMSQCSQGRCPRYAGA